MALLNLVYRDQLFPHQAYRLTFDALLEQLTERQACRTMVDLLALAHDRNCERALAEQLHQALRDKRLPDMAALRARFAPDPDELPGVAVHLVDLGTYDALLSPAGGA